MKILFVYPNVTRARSPQLGICMIAGVAHQLGHECDLYDLTIVPKGKEILTFQSKLQRFDPSILAVSCRSNEWSFVRELLRSAKVDNILKVFGGPHATVAPEEVINIADIVVIGEGEETFSKIIKRVESKEDITDVAGCWIKQGERIIRNEMPNLISNLDELPFPHWGIFSDVHYYDSYIKRLLKGVKVVGAFEGARGCPYACTYCMNHYVRKLYKSRGKWRREKSIERIIQEARLFRDNYGLDYVYWIDEVLLTGIDRLKEFRDSYRSEIKVPFVFMERPENMTDEKVRLIKEAGAHKVSIGIESGDENIRRRQLNRHHSQEVIVSAFRTARKYGLSTHAFTMVGFPGEDKQSINKTYELLREVQPDTAQTTIFYPLRKTKLFEEVVKEGLFDPNMAMPNEYYVGTSLNFPEAKKKELLRYRYLLTYHNSTLISFLTEVHCSQSVFRIFDLYFQVCMRLRQEGFFSVLKNIWNRVFKAKF